MKRDKRKRDKQYQLGHPKPMTQRLPLRDLVRFLAKLKVVTDEHGRTHWMWQRHTDKKGYGQFCLGGVARWAHRCSYVAFIGPIPEGMTVNHKPDCLRPGCCHPDCLELMTIAENTAEGNRRRRE